MKKTIASALAVLLASLGFVVVDKEWTHRVEVLESQVSALAEHTTESTTAAGLGVYKVGDVIDCKGADDISLISSDCAGTVTVTDFYITILEVMGEPPVMPESRPYAEESNTYNFGNSNYQWRPDGYRISVTIKGNVSEEMRHCAGRRLEFRSIVKGAWGVAFSAMPTIQNDGSFYGKIESPLLITESYPLLNITGSYNCSLID